MKKRPLIFVTNDDGINSRGIIALVEVMKKIGDVVIVAPVEEMSGVSHAITMRQLISVEKSNHFDEVLSYKLTGTPVDCVKYGISKILKSKPDLLVSGINHGSNASVNLHYSGTVSAAMEGAIHGIPSIAFSIIKWEVQDIDLEPSKEIVDHISRYVLENPLPHGVLLNVNIPDVPKREIKGIKICRQAQSLWHEDFEEKIDENGKKGYRITGEFDCYDEENDNDNWALNNNYVSVTPLQIDLTAHKTLSSLKKIEINEKV